MEVHLHYHHYMSVLVTSATYIIHLFHLFLLQKIQIHHLLATNKVVLGVAGSNHQGDTTSLCCKKIRDTLSHQIVIQDLNFQHYINHECIANLLLCCAIASSLLGLSKLLQSGGGEAIAFTLFPPCMSSQSLANRPSTQPTLCHSSCCRECNIHTTITS